MFRKITTEQVQEMQKEAWRFVVAHKVRVAFFRIVQEEASKVDKITRRIVPKIEGRLPEIVTALGERSIVLGGMRVYYNNRGGDIDISLILPNARYAECYERSYSQWTGPEFAQYMASRRVDPCSWGDDGEKIALLPSAIKQYNEAVQAAAIALAPLKSENSPFLPAGLEELLRKAM